MTYTEEQAAQALQLARLILARPILVAGLTPVQSKVCHILRESDGRIISADILAECCGCKSPDALRMAISGVRSRRPDIGSRIVAGRGRANQGYAWMETPAPGVGTGAGVCGAR